MSEPKPNFSGEPIEYQRDHTIGHREYWRAILAEVRADIRETRGICPDCGLHGTDVTHSLICSKREPAIVPFVAVVFPEQVQTAADILAKWDNDTITEEELEKLTRPETQV